MDLSPYKWRNRLLLAFAPIASEKKYREQLRLLQSMEAEFEDRALMLGKFFEEAAGEFNGASVSPSVAAGLRETFGVSNGHFTVVLIGKDGGEKFRSHEPLLPGNIFDRIDAMPMRRREMRRREMRRED